MSVSRIASLAVCAILCAAVLSACGQKGPLFLPDEKLEEIKRKKEEREQEEDKSSATQPASRIALLSVPTVLL